MGITHFPEAPEPSRNRDAFGRLRVSSPTNLWTSEFQYNLHPLYFDEITVTGGSVAHLPNESAAGLTVDTQSGASAILQTFEYFRYQPGKSHAVAMTFVAGTLQTDTDMRIGYFDDDNGLFLEFDSTVVNLVRRTKTSGSVVNNKTAQASWSLDPMDGTGPSGITIDWTKGQILWIDFQWLSQGRIRFGFDIDGEIHYVHEEMGANTLDVPTITTPNLPVRWEIVNTGVPSAGLTLTAICSTVMSEGGADTELGHAFGAGNGATLRTGIGTTAVPICSVRPAASLNSITNRIKWKLENIEIWADDSMLWQLIYKPTSITSASFGAQPAHSATEIDIAGTAIVGGVVIASGYIAAANKGGITGEFVRIKHPVALDAAGSDQSASLSIVVTTLGGTNKSAAGMFNWVEIR